MGNTTEQRQDAASVRHLPNGVVEIDVGRWARDAKQAQLDLRAMRLASPNRKALARTAAMLDVTLARVLVLCGAAMELRAKAEAASAELCAFCHEPKVRQ